MSEVHNMLLTPAPLGHKDTAQGTLAVSLCHKGDFHARKESINGHKDIEGCLELCLYIINIA